MYMYLYMYIIQYIPINFHIKHNIKTLDYLWIRRLRNVYKGANFF